MFAEREVDPERKILGDFFFFFKLAVKARLDDLFRSPPISLCFSFPNEVFDSRRVGYCLCALPFQR